MKNFPSARQLVLGILCFPLGCLWPFVHVEARDNLSASFPIRFAISSLAELSPNEPLIQITVEKIKKDFGERNVIVKVYPLVDLHNAIVNGEIDVFISSSGTCYRHSSYGVRNLGTMVSDKLPDPNQSEGSVILVRADRQDLQTISDLKNRKVAVNMKNGFSGNLMAMHEIYKQGYNPNRFFSSIVYVGHHVEKIIEMLFRGEVDVGVLRTCYWENYAHRKGIDIDRLRVINEKKSPLSCRHSTNLYPNWSIASTKHASPVLSRAITKSILDIAPDSENGLYWGVSTDYSAMDVLMRDMEVGPYEKIREITLERLWAEYRGLILSVVAFVIFLIFHNRRSSYLIAKRTQELRSLNQAQILMQKKFNSLQKIGIVGMMSGMVAHEIRQPLGAIKFYAQTILSVIKSGKTPSLDEVKDILTQIYSQTDRIEATVQKVRRLCHRDYRVSVIPIEKRICELFAGVQKETGISAKFEMVGDETASVEIDESSFDLIVANLLRNSLESCYSTPNPTIRVTVEHEAEEFIVITIVNNGAQVPDSFFENLGAIQTSKEKGMGLGLAIVIGLVESFGGSLKFERNTGGGLVASIRLKSGIKFDERKDMAT